MGIKANKMTNIFIDYLLSQGHYVFKINNSPTHRRKNTVKKGVPDILGCTKKGIALGVETKVEDKQREEQKIFQCEFSKRGGIYIIARTLNDLIDNNL